MSTVREFSQEFLEVMAEVCPSDHFESYWGDRYLIEENIAAYVVSCVIRDGYDIHNYKVRLHSDEVSVNKAPFLRQDDFEKGAGNCGITAITSLVLHVNNGQGNAAETYSRVKKAARRYGYTSRFGLFLSSIQKVIKRSTEEKVRTTSYYGLLSRGFICRRGQNKVHVSRNEIIGKVIEDICQNENPVLLSIQSTPWGYNKHMVLVTGVSRFKVGLVNKEGEEIIFDEMVCFKIQDGWHDFYSYLPVSDMGRFLAVSIT